MPVAQPPARPPFRPPGGPSVIPSIRQRRGYRTYLKTGWGDSWHLQFDLRCRRITQALAPSVDNAELIFDTGVIADATDGAFYQRSRLEILDGLAGKYVKIVLLATAPSSNSNASGDSGGDQSGDVGLTGEPADEEVIFIGYIPEQTVDVQKYYSSFMPQIGPQTLAAVGLEWWLDQTPTNHAYCADISVEFIVPDSDPPTVSPGWIRRIGHAPKFNDDYQLGSAAVAADAKRKGNRSPADQSAPLVPPEEPGASPGDSPDAIHIFFGGKSIDEKLPAPWSAYDIAEYLLKAVAPAHIKWRLVPERAGGGTILAALQAYIPAEFAQENRTVKEMLDELFDRRSGFTWRLNFAIDEVAGGGGETEEVMEVEVLSIASGNISVGGDLLLPKSEQTAELFVRDDNNVVSLTVNEDLNARYGRVEVLGNRPLICFTLEMYDPEDPFDTMALEKTWTPSEQTAYEGAAGADDAEENDAAREAERFRHVFTTFRVRRAWNRYTSFGGFTRPAIPKVTDDGKLAITDPDPAFLRIYANTFENFIPVPMEQTQTEFDRDYKPPVVFLRSGTKYVLADQSEAGAGASVRVLDKELGIEVRPRVNHILGLGTFDAGVNGTGTEPEFDYRKMLVTVAMRTDDRMRVIATVPGGDPDRVLTVNVPGCEVHYVLAGTAVDIGTNGELILHAGGLVRDDSTLLRRRASIVRGWYGLKRQTVRASFNTLNTAIRVGEMLEEIIEQLAGGGAATSTTINTPVSFRQFNLEEQTTQIGTDFVELDFDRF